MTGLAQETTVAANVLCVDDDPVTQILLEDIIDSAGHCYRAAHDLAEAEAMLDKEQFDLILLDRKLPGSDGLVLLQRIRQDTEAHVIVLSSMGETQDRLLGLQLGADEYLTKPFNPAELSSRIRNMLHPSRLSPSGPPVTRHIIGEMTFNVATRRLRIGSQSSVLSPAQAKLLSLLLQKHGTLLNRNQLTRSISGRDWAHGDRTVDVLISRLRKLIPIAIGEIVTVHGSGYMFVVK
ncbi:MAG: response regulator transcription factor [Pseudomonadota bacterium]